MNSQTKNKQQGFALLLSIVVVSVVLAISLSFLSLTLKQFTLSVSARDSEMAFHASNTGVECIRYHLSHPSTRPDFLSNGSPSVSCGDSGNESPLSADIISSDGEEIYRKNYKFDVSSAAGDLCADVSVYVAQPTDNDISYVLSNEGLENFTCEEDLTCSVIFSRGFNRPCNDISSIRTVQRELTISF